MLLRLLVLLALCSAVGCVYTPVHNGTIHVTGLDDPLEIDVVVDTHRYARQMVIARGQSDPSLRYITSKDGELDVQIFQVYVLTNSSDWMHWNTARTLINGEASTLEVVEIASDVDCSQYGCSHYETVGVTVSESLLRNYDTSSAAPLVIRLDSGTTSNVHDVQVPAREIRDFIARVDAVRASLISHKGGNG
ncbi:MAG: hypothetical protein AAFX41_03095 [Bacteroidota bacterium]